MTELSNIQHKAIEQVAIGAFFLKCNQGKFIARDFG